MTRAFLDLIIMSVMLNSISTVGNPLQWEQIEPIGSSPAARYSHCMVVFNSSQGMVYLFGGFFGISPSDCESGCKFYNDVWVFDTPAQGWEELNFTASSEPCTTNTPSTPSTLPGARAEHAMASSGLSALMCGGYGPESFFQDNNSLIECWWLTPVRAPRWDFAVISPAEDSAGPSPRCAHTLVFDPDNLAILLFGGQYTTLLGDCWFIDLSQPFNSSEPLFSASLQWSQCAITGPVSPSPRFGHGAAVFRGALYILGGFVYDDLAGIAAQDDMWLLDGYASNGSWARVSCAGLSNRSRLRARPHSGSHWAGLGIFGISNYSFPRSRHWFDSTVREAAARHEPEKHTPTLHSSLSRFVSTVIRTRTADGVATYVPPHSSLPRHPAVPGRR